MYVHAGASKGQGELPPSPAAATQVFCCLAQRKCALFRGWSWPKFLRAAAAALPRAFSAAEAEKRWGADRTKALAQLAAHLYGREGAHEAGRRLQAELGGGMGLYRIVGGREAWEELADALAVWERR